MIRDLARDFTRAEVTPLANRLDPQKGDFPPALVEKMGARGFFGILIPQRTVAWAWGRWSTAWWLKSWRRGG